MPKTKEQFEQIKKERISKIEKSALFLFSVKGYDAVTMDDIARESDSSHGLIFHYFSNKQILYEHIVNDVSENYMREIVKDVNFSQSPKFVFMDLLNAYLAALKSSNDDYAYTIFLKSTMPIRKSPIKKEDKNRDMYWLLNDLIEKGQKDNTFYNTNSMELTIACLSLIRGLALARINIGYKRFRPPKSETIAKMIIKM